ncbi:transporter substrate-binding domain-containing protein [Hymenobacter sp. BT507]|uniref:Transporter substrate-binding domain-containing protein n=1 Tax=Hymenobacter citatus TaxID=2763506 RepID=A0ABR7MGL3_9BACT|nr:transporter substrate-binding domain-containing protein [Hymenobacter citatus]MBC6609880.1 transporter substrate-binding domain-containing protein [Hymenobacter citatus]
MIDSVRSLFTLFFFPFVLLLSACSEYPKDPERTLQKVENGILQVGYSDNPPWVIKTDQDPIGIEPELVKGFAKSLHATVRWHNDTEQGLFEGLKRKQYALVVAGITDDTPWKQEKIGLTRPYREGHKKHVMAIMQGENAFLVRLENYLYQQNKAATQHRQP